MRQSCTGDGSAARAARVGSAATVLLAALALSSAGSAIRAGAAEPATGGLDLRVRDSSTGAAVRARLFSSHREDGGVTAFTASVEGRAEYRLPAGRHEVTLTGAGHRPLTTRFELAGQETLRVTVWLDPEAPPEELRPEAVAAEMRPGFALIHGHVLDVDSAQPLSGVRVSLEQAPGDALTDDRGYFRISVPVRPIDPVSELPDTDALVVEQPGYRSERLGRVLLAEGDTHFIVDLQQGQGVVRRDNPHKMLRSPAELAAAQSAPGATSGGDVVSSTREPGVGSRAVGVPSTIRVGFNCNCANCSTVQVYSLDTYVQKGLDDEWIPSWTSDSLKAGAVAYRSYGVYHVYNPRAPNYDICSTTCCQVNNPATSSTSTNNAVTATSGYIVVNATGSGPFFAEYAAENNDNFCADGFVGRPANNWPCMSDVVDAGRPFNGHGRGMCQWGTQRWSANQAKDWLWITDHYYNDNGNPSGARAGFLQAPGMADFALSATPASQTVPPGGSTTYTVTVTPSGGFSGTVALSVSGLPAGTTGSFNPPSLPGTGSSTLSVSTSASTPMGSYPLTITGTSGTLQHTAAVTLVVSAPGANFSLSVSPTFGSVARGSSTTFTVTLTPIGGFSGTVSFSTIDRPPGVTASFNPPSVNTSGSSTLTLNASSSAALGTFTIVVRGKSGAQIRTTTLSLTVTATGT